MKRAGAWCVRVRSALAAAALAAAAATASAAPTTLTIVHFNDLDRMEERNGRGGIARLAAVIAAERARAGPLLVTFAGDSISPSLLSAFDKGAHAIDLLNRLGLDAMALGNHEFDFGPAVARQRIAEATFPVLAANVREADGGIIGGARASIMVEAGGFTVGLFGLTTAGTAVKSSPGDVTFRPVTEVAAEQARALRAAGADLVIALAHTDAGEDAALLAQGAVDLLLSGDDHLLRVDYDGRVLFAESGEQADRVTVIDLALSGNGRGSAPSSFAWSPAFRVIDTARVAPDQTMAAAVEAHLARLSREMDVEIGRTLTALNSRRAAVRGGEAAIGNLVADAMRWATGADIALTNGGGIRGNRVYPPGSRLTRRDLRRELPFGNRTVVLEATGRAVIAALEHGLGAVEKRAGRFPHISGLRVRYAPARPAGHRVLTATLDGTPLDPDGTYTLATNEFLARGGDGYAMLARAHRLVDANAGTLAAVQAIRYVAARGTIAPAIDARLRAVGE